jgi:hypothetical protein
MILGASVQPGWLHRISMLSCWPSTTSRVYSRCNPVNIYEFVGLSFGALFARRFSGNVDTVDYEAVLALLRFREVSARGTRGVLLTGRGSKPITG